MKKFWCIVMLLCIIMSVCTAGAWADEPNTGVNRVETGSRPSRIDNTFGAANYKERFYLEIYSNKSNGAQPGYDKISNESFEVRLQNGKTILSSTKLNSGAAGTSTSLNCVLYGSPSGSWTTEWYYPLSETLYPNRVVFVVDKVKTFTYDLDMTVGDYFNFRSIRMPIVVMSKGIVKGYYETLDEAVAAAPADCDILIRTAGTYKLPDAAVRIVLNGTVDGVIIDMESKEAPNYVFGDKIKVINRATAPNPPAPEVPGVPAAPAAPETNNVYYIPVTDDNSNMLLWSILALVFVSTAIVTGKRKNDN